MTTPKLPPRPMSGWSLRPIEESDLARYGSPYDGDDMDLEYVDYEIGLGDRIRNFVGRILLRVGWVVLPAGLAFGSAGIVAGRSICRPRGRGRNSPTAPTFSCPPSSTPPCATWPAKGRRRLARRHGSQDPGRDGQITGRICRRPGTAAGTTSTR